MGRPPHAHWALRILKPVLSPLRAVYQNLEENLVKATSNIETIRKGGDRTNAEPMESRVPKTTGTVKDRYFIRTYFSKIIPLKKVLHQDRLIQGCNTSSTSGIRCLSRSKKVRGTIKVQCQV